MRDLSATTENLYRGWVEFLGQVEEIATVFQ